MTPQETAEQRQRDIDASVKRLEKSLMERRAKVVVGPDGALAFSGDWQDRKGVSDVCAYRRLMVAGSFALRTAVAAAEAASGRKVNERAIAGGSHSHDGGRTWGKD
jgi:hypothetical protein